MTNRAKIYAAAIAFALIAVTTPAAAQSATCYPALGAKGFVMDVTPDGSYGAWWCLRGYDWAMVQVFAKSGYAIVHPPGTSGLADLAIAQAYWAANVKQSCNTADAAALRLCDAAYNAALNTRPLPPWVVRTNGSSATRPTYPVVNGVRSTTSNGTVLVVDIYGRPTACDPSFKVGSYMRVKADTTVALCSPS